MGRRGPKKKPTALIVMEGNPGNHSSRRLQDDMKPKPGLPEPPDWLYPEAVTEWYRLGDQLAALGVMTTVDYMAFAVLCQQYGRWVRLEWDLKNEPELVAGSTGSLVLNPRFALLRQCIDDIKRMLPHFGLTPATRNDIAIAGNDADEKEKWSLFEKTRASTQKREKPNGRRDKVEASDGGDSDV